MSDILRKFDEGADWFRYVFQVQGQIGKVMEEEFRVKEGLSPLMLLASCGSTSACERLLVEWRVEVNAQDEEGKSALFYAVRGGHLECIKVLIKHGADMNLRDNKWATILHHLIEVSVKYEMPMEKVKSVLEYFVDDRWFGVNRRAEDGSTILHEACRRGLSGLANYLIKKGADLDIRTRSGDTPLWSAVTAKNPSKDVILLLAREGADFNQLNLLGMTVTEYARAAESNVLVSSLEFAQLHILSKRRCEENGKTRRTKIFQKSKGLHRRYIIPPDDVEAPQAEIKMMYDGQRHGNTQEDAKVSSDAAAGESVTREQDVGAKKRSVVAKTVEKISLGGVASDSDLVTKTGELSLHAPILPVVSSKRSQASHVRIVEKTSLGGGGNKNYIPGVKKAKLQSALNTETLKHSAPALPGSAASTVGVTMKRSLVPLVQSGPIASKKESDVVAEKKAKLDSDLDAGTLKPAPPVLPATGESVTRKPDVGAKKRSVVCLPKTVKKTSLGGVASTSDFVGAAKRAKLDSDGDTKTRELSPPAPILPVVSKKGPQEFHVGIAEKASLGGVASTNESYIVSGKKAKLQPALDTETVKLSASALPGVTMKRSLVPLAQSGPTTSKKESGVVAEKKAKLDSDLDARTVKPAPPVLPPGKTRHRKQSSSSSSSDEDSSSSSSSSDSSS